jgi:hypothetical protein
MADKQIGAALCVGVSMYRDKELGVLPAASSSARDMEKALQGMFTKGVRLLADPPGIDDLFVGLQRAMRDARGGTLLLYYAGHTLRRGNDLLLTVGDSVVEGPKVCVPWSDIEDLLGRERVTQAVVLLNVDQPTDAPLAIEKEGVCVMGSVRVHDRASANTKLRAYGEAVLEALRRPAAEVAPYLTDGKLDVGGLDRYLAERAPKTLGHRLVASGGEIDLVLRDLKAQLEAAKSQPAAAPPEAAPVEPVAAPVEPVAAPAEPVVAPAEPEAAPAEPEAPVEPEAAPVEAPPKKKKKAPLARTEAPPAEIVPATPPPSRLPLILLVVAVVIAILYFLTRSG